MEDVETAGVSIHPVRILANVMKDLEKIRGTYVEVRLLFFSVSFFCHKLWDVPREIS